MTLGTGTPITTADPAGWKASYYVLCVPVFSVSPDGRLSFDYDLNASGVFRMSDLAAATPSIGSIEEFIAAVFRKQDMTALKTRPFETTAKVMEFGLRQDAYIVISLGKLNWQFDQNYFAISFDPDALQYYGNLNQIDAAGKKIPMPFDSNGPIPPPIPPIGPSCTVAYFSAKLAPAASPLPQHAFDLHVEIIQGNQTVAIRIDPDIKNDGNQPTWPP